MHLQHFVVSLDRTGGLFGVLRTSKPMGRLYPCVVSSVILRGIRGDWSACFAHAMKMFAICACVMYFSHMASARSKKKKPARTDNTQGNFDFDHVRTVAQRSIMVRAQKEGECLFCAASIKKFHKRPILKQNRSWIVTKNKFPYAGTRLHLLLIHKRHIRSVTEVKADEWGDLGGVLSWICAAYKVKGGSFFFRFGDTQYTGATIAHLHGHFILGVNRARAKGAVEPRLAYGK